MCAAPDVGATASQRVHPVLIRNDANEWMRVIVEAGQPDVHATAFTFSLQGGGELKNIETLRLFYSGDKEPQDLDKVHSGWKTKSGYLARLNRSKSNEGFLFFTSNENVTEVQKFQKEPMFNALSQIVSATLTNIERDIEMRLKKRLRQKSGTI